MRILGIETSCDETGIAIVNEQRKILANVLLSQIELHKIYGGVVPEVAARNHLEVIDKLIAEAMLEAQLKFTELDAIACTGGPGLIGGVIVGVMAAKTMASVLHKPFLPLNHLEGHALMPRFFYPELQFPFLLLLISGGHCQILLAQGVSQYQQIGATIDDSLGEAFDKVAKVLKLAYPGGPKIEQLALGGNAQRFPFPQPLTQHYHHDRYNFSFSGLKTAVVRTVENLAGCSLEEYLSNPNLQLSTQDRADLCASFQYTVIQILLNRIEHALIDFALPQSIQQLVISGGVAANLAIRQAIKAKVEQLIPMGQIFCPPVPYCTDNGLMIAWAGLERFRLGLIDPQSLTFSPRSRWSLAELSA